MKEIFIPYEKLTVGNFVLPEGFALIRTEIKKEEGQLSFPKNIRIPDTLFPFELELSYKNQFTLLMLPRCPSAVRVDFGPATELMFQKFQIHFDVSVSALEQELEAGLTLLGLLNLAQQPKKEEISLNDLVEKFPEYLALDESSEHPISSDFSLEDCLFSTNRIQKYFTACDFDTLDFCLTYNNKAILSAIQNEDSLKSFLKKCPRVIVKQDSFPRALSLMYPRYLLSYKKMCKQLSDSWKEVRGSNNYPKYWLSTDIDREFDEIAAQREIVSIGDCWNTLCILSGRDSELRIGEKNKEAAIKNCKYINHAVQRFQLAPLSSEEIVNAYTPSYRDQHDDAWNHEDILSYFCDYQCCEESEKYLSPRERNLIEFISSIESDKGHLGALSEIGRLDNSNLFGRFPNCLFFGAQKVPNDVKRWYYGGHGNIAYYLKASMWDNNKKIKHRCDFSKDTRLRIYNDFLQWYTIMLIFHGRFGGIEEFSNSLNDLMSYCESREAAELLSLFSCEGDKLTKQDYESIAPHTILKTEIGPLPIVLPKAHAAIVTDAIKEFRFREQVTENKLKAERAAADAQKEVFRSMNHSIKNLVASVTGALDRLKEETAPQLTIPNDLIRQAIQGASLISEIANAITLSYRSNSKIDWEKDLIPNDEGTRLLDIVHSALFYSVPHMFNNNLTLYMHESKQYFSTTEQLQQAEMNWYQLGTRKEKLSWIDKNICHLLIDIQEGVSNIEIGNQYSTTINLFILLNELFLNALKGTAYADISKRLLQLEIYSQNNLIVFDIQNTTTANYAHAPKMGFGHLIVENFLHMYNAQNIKYEFDQNSEKYVQQFSLPLIQQ